MDVTKYLEKRNCLWHDSHQIPFSMNIDFTAVVNALKETGYKGYFTLEADAYHVSRATVYNTIDLLCECGILRKHQFSSHQAQYELALCYIEGCGVDQNIELAAEYLYKSAKQGNEDALEFIALLEASVGY